MVLQSSLLVLLLLLGPAGLGVLFGLSLNLFFSILILYILFLYYTIYSSILFLFLFYFRAEILKNMGMKMNEYEEINH